MKTKIVLTEKPEHINVGNETDNEMKRAIFLALKEKGLLTGTQCEECIRRITLEGGRTSSG